MKHSNLKILIADDDIVSRKMLEKALKDCGYKLVITRNGEAAWEALIEDKDIQLIILDWMMPKIDGIELCRKIRNLNKDKNTYTYIILLTSKDTPEDVLKGLSSGADDYITKPFHHLELKARLNTGIRIIELHNRLTQDSLTKLPNRNKIIQHLDEELNRSLREKKPVGVIMADIDNFKMINDTYGHQVGDEVLIEIASRLQRNLRRYDKIGRYAGDELLIVIPNCKHSNLKGIAERLRKNVSDNKITTGAGLLEVTLSLGCASSEHFPFISTGELIKASDEALYMAKRNGRNCVIVSKISTSKIED